MKRSEYFNAEDQIDLKLLESSTFFLNGEINEDSVGECVRWLIYENLDVAKEKTLTLYINSAWQVQGTDMYLCHSIPI